MSGTISAFQERVRIRAAWWLFALLVTIIAVGLGTRDPFGASTAVGRPSEETRIVSASERDDAIRRGRVLRDPPVPVADASLGADPDHPDELTCRFKLSRPGGTTPKFDCVLDTGEEVRVKYGNVGEIPGEVAATRLLTALGFAADKVRLVERLQCVGCPVAPFPTMKVVAFMRAGPLYERVLNKSGNREFAWVAVERKLKAPAIETSGQEGWAFHELDRLKASTGALREHVDALRLMAVFLAHWDNKPGNQRVVCLSSDWPAGARCPDPFLMLQDVGSTFGPRKVDLAGWEKAPIWADRATCTISMDELPYQGGTFSRSRISEGGRRLLGSRLAQLADRQLTELFAGARFDHRQAPFVSPRPVSEWVRVFRQKVSAITEGPPCPDVLPDQQATRG